MKAADIVVGETYAALGPNYAVGHWIAAPVRVVMEPRSGTVTVASPDGTRRQVATRDIKCLWSEQVAARKAQEDGRERLVKGLEETARKRNEAAAYLASVLPDEALPYWAKGRPAQVHADASGVWGMDTTRYSTTELAAVVRAAIAHSQEA
jgi:hypothetical protein